MAIDSQPPISALDGPEASTIENELPAYRAISVKAVVSVVLGLAAVFCFTSLWFLLLAGAAVLFGWSALRSIKRLPDILTGAGLAKTGIGLGVAFGLTAATRTIAEDLMLTYDASQFSRLYVETIKSKPLAEAIWYKQSVAYRLEKTPEETLDELRKVKNPAGDAYTTETGPILAVKEILKDPKADVHFSKIETKLVDGLTHHANALLDLDSPTGEQFALVELVKDPGSNFGEWRVKDFLFPYKPKSAGVQVEKKDDGHGHSH